MTKTAVIAGQGRLPALLAGALEAPLVAALQGFAPEDLRPDIEFRVERLVPFLNHLLDQASTTARNQHVNQTDSTHHLDSAIATEFIHGLNSSRVDPGQIECILKQAN